MKLYNPPELPVNCELCLEIANTIKKGDRINLLVEEGGPGFQPLQLTDITGKFVRLDGTEYHSEKNVHHCAIVSNLEGEFLPQETLQFLEERGVPLHELQIQTQ